MLLIIQKNIHFTFANYYISRFTAENGYLTLTVDCSYERHSVWSKIGFKALGTTKGRK